MHRYRAVLGIQTGQTPLKTGNVAWGLVIGVTPSQPLQVGRRHISNFHQKTCWKSAIFLQCRLPWIWIKF